MMDAENKPVSLRKIASWLNVPWSTVQYKPKRQKPPRMDSALERQVCLAPGCPSLYRCFHLFSS